MAHATAPAAAAGAGALTTPLPVAGDEVARLEALLAEHKAALKKAKARQAALSRPDPHAELRATIAKQQAVVERKAAELAALPSRVSVSLRTDRETALAHHQQVLKVLESSLASLEAKPTKARAPSSRSSTSGSSTPSVKTRLAQKGLAAVGGGWDKPEVVAAWVAEHLGPLAGATPAERAAYVRTEAEAGRLEGQQVKNIFHYLSGKPGNIARAPGYSYRHCAGCSRREQVYERIGDMGVAPSASAARGGRYPTEESRAELAALLAHTAPAAAAAAATPEPTEDEEEAEVEDEEHC